MRPSAFAALALAAALLPAPASAGLVYDFTATDGSGVTAQLLTDMEPAGGGATILGSDVIGFRVQGNPHEVTVPPPGPPYGATGGITASSDLTSFDGGSIRWLLGSPSEVAASVMVRTGGLSYVEDNPDFDFDVTGIWQLELEADTIPTPEPSSLAGAVAGMVMMAAITLSKAARRRRA